MSKTGNDATEQMCDRVGAWCRQVYPKNGAKLMASDMDISERTAKSFLAGQSWPCHRTLADMSAKWGSTFIQFITEPAMQAGDTGDIHALRSAITAIQTRLDRMEAQEAYRNRPLAYFPSSGAYGLGGGVK